jgi:Ca2+/Na+ antiporter
MADSIFSVLILVLTIIMLMVFMRSGWRLSRREGAIIFTIAILRMVFEIYVGRMS